MNDREELEDRANQAIERWNDESLPPMPGNPSFQVVAKEPLENILISYQLLNRNRHGYIYLFDAQEVLDSFVEVDRAELEKAWAQSSAAQGMQ
jgi:hypothetical protein